MDYKDINPYLLELKSGNMEAFDVIYLNSKNLVFATILAICKDYALSEDLMQDTYVNLINNIHRYKPNGNGLGYIATIARNLALNAIKRRKNEIEVDLSSSELTNKFIEESKEESIILNDALTHLPLDERQILLMYLSGLKHNEIAKILNKPLGTITWMYSEAIKKLRNIYQKEEIK